MKRINLFGLALVSFVMFSCGNDNSNADTTVEEEVAVEETIVEEETEVVSQAEVPNFENEDLAEFAGDFGAYMDKAIALMKAGDMEGLESLEEEGKALQEKGENLKEGVSDSDKTLLEEYLKGKAMEMLSASGLDKLGEKMQEEMTKE